MDCSDTLSQCFDTPQIIARPRYMTARLRYAVAYVPLLIHNGIRTYVRTLG